MSCLQTRYGINGLKFGLGETLHMEHGSMRVEYNASI